MHPAVFLRSYNQKKLRKLEPLGCLPNERNECWRSVLGAPFGDVHKHYYLHQCPRRRRGYARLCSLSLNFAMQSFTFLGLATALLSPAFVNASKCRPKGNSSASYAVSSASSGVAYPSSACTVNDCLKGKKDMPGDIFNACRTKME